MKTSKYVIKKVQSMVIIQILKKIEPIYLNNKNQQTKLNESWQLVTISDILVASSQFLVAL